MILKSPWLPVIDSSERWRGRFTLSPGSSAQIYIRYRGANWSGLAPILETEESFRTAQTTDLVIYLVLFGGIITLVVIGGISFLFLGQRVVIYYALAQLAFFAFYTHFTGISTVYLFPESAQSLRFVAPLTMGLFTLFICQFARHFFDTGKNLRVINNVLLVLIMIAGCALVLMPFAYGGLGLGSQLPVFLVYLSCAATWILLPVLAAYVTLKWRKDYWPLIIAWGSTGSFVIVMLLIFLGILSVMPLEENMFGVAIYLEAGFLALAIALRVRVLREEALVAERQLSESLRAELEASERAKRYYEEREWAIQDLAEKGRLLLTAGHDTRQMISALRNFSAGIRLVSQEQKVEQATHKIDEIVGSLNEVLTTAVEGSRSGGITDSTLALDTVRPEKILNAVILIHDSSARDKNIELSIRVSAGPVVTDRVLVGRVLGNLLSNAIKNTRDGRIVVACRPFQGGHRFQVWDQGSGIMADDLRDLLDPETGAMRLDSTTEGFGSGLAIVKTLAKRLGAGFDARSTPGRGSVFELILPAVKLPEFTGDKTTTKPSIILADDDAEQLGIFSETVSMMGLGYKHCSSPDAVKALLTRETGGLQLLFIDEHFGGAKQGLELVRTLSRKNAEFKTLLLTYNQSIESRMDMAEVASILLYKPLSRESIRAALFRATLQI